MFGREPRLPIDIALGLDCHQDRQPTSYSMYVQNIKEILKKSYHLASEAIKNLVTTPSKENYDLRTPGAVLQVDDRVFVKVVACHRRHKLADKWEEQTYVITIQPNEDIPVYEVRREYGGGRKRVLHRNLLLPIGSLREFDKEKTPPKPAPRTTTVPKPTTLDEE